MSFPQAIQSVFSKYVGFTGRARRSEYWWWTLFTVLVGIATSILDNVLGTRTSDEPFATGWITSVANLALFLPSLAVSIRRLHDTGRSGWWVLLGLIPIVGTIILIVWFVGDSKPGTNEHGPNPKELAAPGAAPVTGY